MCIRRTRYSGVVEVFNCLTVFGSNAGGNESTVLKVPFKKAAPPLALPTFRHPRLQKPQECLLDRALARRQTNQNFENAIQQIRISCYDVTVISHNSLMERKVSYAAVNK